MKKNELKAIERALNEKSEESVVYIANEIGDDLVGWKNTTNIITHHLLILYKKISVILIANM